MYISQHAYARKLGQTRNELSVQDWMHKYELEYLTAAKTIALIDRIHPQHKEYDICWIAGASRIGALCRIIDYYYLVSTKNIKIGKTQILTGARELTADMDGVTPAILNNLAKAYRENIDLDKVDIALPLGDSNTSSEGISYMSSLAERYSVKLDSSFPFIQCTKNNCLSGRYPDKLYANYLSGEKTILTEALMIQDLLITYPPPNNLNITIVSEKIHNPNTITTARYAAEELAQCIIKGDWQSKKSINLLLQTNNPYVSRQTLAVQREVNKIFQQYELDKNGYKVYVEGIGYSCRQGVVSIHSELAALIAEKRQTAIEDMQKTGSVIKRSSESLKFQVRDNLSIVPAHPDVLYIDLSGNFITEFFDEYLS